MSKSESEPDIYIEFCRAIANKVGLLGEETSSIFDFEVEEPALTTPVSLHLVVKEKRPIEFQETSQILEVLGDNQAGKTFTLLYLSNLLGYNFFDEENKKFLADENVVRQGQKVFRRLQNEVAAKLDVVAESDTLSISVEQGDAEIAMAHNSEKVLKHGFDLKTQSNAFRDYLKRFVDVQFVSKGRNFDGQLLIDISAHLRKCLGIALKETDNLVISYKNKLDELAAGRTIDELHEAKTAISDEIKQLNVTLAELTTSITDIQSKLTFIEEVNSKLEELDKTKAFEIHRSIVQLDKKLQLGEKKQLEDQLESIRSELTAKKSIFDVVEKEFIDAITRVTQKGAQFIDKISFSTFLGILRDREIDSLEEVRERYDHSTYAVVEKIHSQIKDFDKTIRLPSELGGSVESFQSGVGKSLGEISDHRLKRSLTESLIDVINKHQIQSSAVYSTLRKRIEELQQEESQLTEEIAEASPWSSKQREEMQERLASLKREFASLEKADRDKIVELEAILQTYENLSAIFHSANWKEELLRLKFAVKEELRKAEEERRKTNGKIEESRKRLLAIDGILSKPELTLSSEGMDRLSKFSGILATLNKVLENKESLINRDLAQDEFAYLSEFGVPSLLDDTINKIFLSRCKYYFEMAGENRCQIFDIKGFDYKSKLFFQNDVQKSVIDLSGGTASIMTVLSLATRTTDSMFGKVLLIDEFHDVAAVLRREAYKLLQPIERLSFAFFAKPVDGLELTIRKVEVAN